MQTSMINRRNRLILDSEIERARMKRLLRLRLRVIGLYDHDIRANKTRKIDTEPTYQRDVYHEKARFTLGGDHTFPAHWCSRRDEYCRCHLEGSWYSEQFYNEEINSRVYYKDQRSKIHRSAVSYHCYDSGSRFQHCDKAHNINVCDVRQKCSLYDQNINGCGSANSDGANIRRQHAPLKATNKTNFRKPKAPWGNGLEQILKDFSELQDRSFRRKGSKRLSMDLATIEEHGNNHVADIYVSRHGALSSQIALTTNSRSLEAYRKRTSKNDLQEQDTPTGTNEIETEVPSENCPPNCWSEKQKSESSSSLSSSITNSARQRKIGRAEMSSTQMDDLELQIAKFGFIVSKKPSDNGNSSVPSKKKRTPTSSDSVTNINSKRKTSTVSSASLSTLASPKRTPKTLDRSSSVPHSMSLIGSVTKDSRNSDVNACSCWECEHAKRLFAKSERSKDALKSRKGSTSSKVALSGTGTSRASITDPSNVTGVGRNHSNARQAVGFDFSRDLFSAAFDDRKPSVSSKVREWRLMNEADQLTGSGQRFLMRHSASLPSLMSSLSRQFSKNQPQQQQHQHHESPSSSQHGTKLRYSFPSSTTHQQQQQQQQSLHPFQFPPGRRLRRRSSLAFIQSESNGSWRTGRKFMDNFGQAGHKSFFRRTMSQGDFSRLLPGKSFMPLVRFRRAIKMVLLLLRATFTSREESQRRERQFNMWMALSDGLSTSKRAYDMYGISFDPQDFKANREIQVSSEAKAILSMEPGQRSTNQLRVVLASLRQAVPEFSEFPITMQESLARVGWYERFEAKRVIIRQGHLADNFYFILSGTAVVIILDTDKQTGEQTARTAAFLGRGKSFGELALMHKARRSATVTCKTSVELLAVGREDFIDIFMHVERNVEPEHVRFLRTLSILQDWPVHELPVDNPQVLLFTYVRRGVLLCRDSNHSEWIYIVKSGSCTVIKALREASVHSSLSARRDSPIQRSASRSSSRASGKATLGGAEKSKDVKRIKRERTIQSVPWIQARSNSTLERSALQHLETLDVIMDQRHGQLETTESDHSSASSRSSSQRNGQRSKPHNTVFVQILKLGPRDIYGLESSLFRSMKHTTSTSLVSDGAELIMINTKFFMDHTSEELRKRIRSEIHPLPSDESLQSQLQTMVNWQAYRDKTLHSTLSATRFSLPTV